MRVLQPQEMTHKPMCAFLTTGSMYNIDGHGHNHQLPIYHVRTTIVPASPSSFQQDMLKAHQQSRRGDAADTLALLAILFAPVCTLRVHTTYF